MHHPPVFWPSRLRHRGLSRPQHWHLSNLNYPDDVELPKQHMSSMVSRLAGALCAVVWCGVVLSLGTTTDSITDSNSDSNSYRHLLLRRPRTACYTDGDDERIHGHRSTWWCRVELYAELQPQAHSHTLWTGVHLIALWVEFNASNLTSKQATMYSSVV